MTTKLIRATASGRRDINLIILDKMKPQFVKQMFDNNYLFKALKTSKTVKPQRGGKLVKQGLRLGNTANMGTFGRGDTKTAEYVDTLSECQTRWRRYYASILTLLVDEQEASGDMAMISKKQADLEDKNDGLMELMEADLYGGQDSTGEDNVPGNALDGLQAMIANNPMKTGLPVQGAETTFAGGGLLMGINQSDLNQSYWRNITLDFNGSNDYNDAFYGVTAASHGRGADSGYVAGELGNGSDYVVDPMADLGWAVPTSWNVATGTAANQGRGAADGLEDAMEWMAKTCSNGKEGMRPDLIITTKAIHSWFKRTQLSYVQIGYEQSNFGFKASVYYEGIPIVYSDYVPAGTMYFINSKFMHLTFDPKYFFAYTKMKDLPGHIDDQVMYIMVMLSTILSRRNVHGVIHGINYFATTASF